MSALNDIQEIENSLRPDYTYFKNSNEFPYNVNNVDNLNKNNDDRELNHLIKKFKSLLKKDGTETFGVKKPESNEDNLGPFFNDNKFSHNEKGGNIYFGKQSSPSSDSEYHYIPLLENFKSESASVTDDWVMPDDPIIQMFFLSLSCLGIYILYKISKKTNLIY